jgi:type IV pilus assembly protein PilC
MLRLPIVGGIMKAYLIGMLTRTLSLLLESGLTLRDALPEAARAVPYGSYRTELISLQAPLEEGSAMSALLGRSELFPELAVQMVSVGEASGSLPESLRALSSYYESEVDELTKRLSSLIEPFLMLLMGGIVGFVAISMITPLYEITQHLHAR